MNPSRFITCLAAAVALPLSAQAQASACASQESIGAATSQIDAALESVGNDSGIRRKQLESQIQAKAKALGWPKERQSELLRGVLASPAYWAFEEEKKPHVTSLANAVMASSGPSPRLSKCEAALQVKALAAKVVEVNTRQYDNAAREVDLALGGKAR